MPVAAFRTGSADFVLSLEEIGRTLEKLVVQGDGP
jgi:hypothetical protein